MSARPLDHVGYVGPRLDALLDGWRRLGFAPTVPHALEARDADGRPVSLQQQSAHVMFERGYVELSAVASRDPAHHLARYAGRYDGVQIVAFAADDVRAAHAQAGRAGLAVTAPALAARRVDYGSDPGEARFHWFMATPDAAPEALLCVVEHLTPSRIYQPEVLSHPNGAVALRRCAIVTAAPDESTARLHALGVAGSGDVELLTPTAAAARWPGVTLPPPPCVCAVTVAVADLERARHCVRSGGIAITPTSAGFRVDPEHAGGAVLEYEAA